MKHLKHIVITVLLLIASITNAQKTQKDSIAVQIENNINVKMSIYDYYELKETVENDLKQLHSILKEDKEIPDNSPYIILFKPNKKLNIKNLETTEKTIWENGKHKNYNFENTCEIRTENYLMVIEYNDLEELISEDLITHLKDVIDETSTKENRYSRLFNYTFKDNILVDSNDYTLESSNDYLYLKSGVGANLIKSEFVIDFNFELGFGLSKKGIQKSQYYASYNLLYDFIDNSSIDLNGFLSLGFRHNFSDRDDKNNWIGMEFGYLITQNGELFNDDTFRFGVNWELSSSISVSPQIYFNSELTYPGLRIGIGL